MYDPTRPLYKCMAVLYPVLLIFGSAFAYEVVPREPWSTIWLIVLNAFYLLVAPFLLIFSKKYESPPAHTKRYRGLCLVGGSFVAGIAFFSLLLLPVYTSQTEIIGAMVGSSGMPYALASFLLVT